MPPPPVAGRKRPPLLADPRFGAACAAGAVMFAAAVPLLIAFVVLDLYLWGRNGGTFGGMGAAADSDYHGHLWSTVLLYAALATAIVIDLAVGRWMYRRVMRRFAPPS